MEKKKIHLLMIEDSFGDARLIYEMLRDSSTVDFKIEQAFRLSTGIEMLKNKYFDIVLLDLALPDSFGLDTLKSVIPESKGIPIVVMTANDDEALGIQAVHLGAQDYIMKLQYDSYSLVKALCFAIERKKNEEILAYQTKLLNNVQEGIIVLDREFKITSWNKAAERIYGWKESEVIGRKICNVITSCFCNSKQPEETLNLLTGGIDHIAKIEQQNKSGIKLIIEERSMAMFSSDGVLTGYICMNKDITENKNGQKKHDDNSIFKMIFDNTSTMLAYLDRELNIVKINNAFAATVLFEAEYYSGKNHFELFQDPEIEAVFRRVLETGESHSIFAKAFELKACQESNILYFDWNIIPVKDSKGEVSGIILSLSDVTNRIKAQAAVVE